MINFIGLKVINIVMLNRRIYKYLFLAVKLSDSGADKSTLIKNLPNYWQQEQNNYSINELALNNELQSMIMNIE